MDRLIHTERQGLMTRKAAQRAQRKHRQARKPGGRARSARKRSRDSQGSKDFPPLSAHLAALSAASPSAAPRSSKRTTTAAPPAPRTSADRAQQLQDGASIKGARKKLQGVFCPTCGVRYAAVALTFARAHVVETAKQVCDVFMSNAGECELSDEESHVFGRLIARVAELRQVEQR